LTDHYDQLSKPVKKPAEYELFDRYIENLLPTTIEDEYFEYVNG